MDEDDDSDSEWQQKRKEKKRRLMRLLHAQALKKLECAGGESLNGVVHRDSKGLGQRIENLSKDDSKIDVQQVKNRKVREKSYANIEDDDYLLESIHKIKHFVRRLWNWALCYTQYCYPGLRTVEYYKKVKAKHCNKKKSHDKNKKKAGEGASGPAPVPCCSEHTDHLAEAPSLNQMYISDDEDCSLSHHESSQKVENLVHPIDETADEADEEMSWSEAAISKINETSHAVSHLVDEKSHLLDFGTFLKWMCIVLAPAVLLLGVHFVMLRRKYYHLSRKVKKVREDNDSLVDECNHLENILSSTEKIEMPFSTKQSREEVVNEFTRLAESRLRAKNELSQMSTKRMALLEELKTARKQRDSARQQYDAMTNNNGTPLSGSHLKTQATV